MKILIMIKTKIKVINEENGYKTNKTKKTKPKANLSFTHGNKSRTKGAMKSHKAQRNVTIINCPLNPPPLPLSFSIHSPPPSPLHHHRKLPLTIDRLLQSLICPVNRNYVCSSWRNLEGGEKRVKNSKIHDSVLLSKILLRGLCCGGEGWWGGGKEGRAGGGREEMGCDGHGGRG